MKVVSHEEAMGLFDYVDLIAFMEEQHRLPPALVDDSWTESAEGNGMLARTGFVPGSGLGVKLASVFPGNTRIPTVHSVYVLFDPDTGEEAAVIEGNAITWFKTACDSGLGCRHLARTDSRHLVMVGAGSMAPHLIRAHLAARPSIERVTIWNRTPARARDLAESLGDDRVTVSEDLAGAVQSADLVSCATMTIDPLIAGEWLAPGTHVDLVGAFKADMREVDDEALRRSRIFVDSRATIADIGELRIPLENGVIAEPDLLGDHYQLAQGAVEGRTSDDEITLFKNGGGGHLDLMAAQFLLGRI